MLETDTRASGGVGPHQEFVDLFEACLGDWLAGCSRGASMNARRWNHGAELERLDCGVDFGDVVGDFVRLSLERDDGGTEGVSLDADEAEVHANRLHEAAELAKKRQKGEAHP